MAFSCPFGRYSDIKLPFGTAPAGNMLQKKIDGLLNDIPNVFGIANNILIVGYDADNRDHDKRLEQVLCRCRQANLKLNKEKGLSR